MAGKEVKITNKKGKSANCLCGLYLAYMLALLIIVISAVIFLLMLFVAQFPQILVPALVMIAGISWALRTANVHQYEMTERSMEAYIWLYNGASRRMQKGYLHVIKGYNDGALADLPNAKLFSYMTLYLFFGVVLLFISEVFVLLFCHGHLQCLCICWTASFCCDLPCIFLLLFLAMSCIFFASAFVTLIIRLCGNNGKEVFKCFKAFSACFAERTRILKEDWIKSYRKKPKRPLSPYEKELIYVIQKDTALQGLREIYVDFDI